LHLKNSGMRVCNLILGPPGDWFWSTDHLEEAIRQLQVVQDEHQEADAKLKVLWSSSTWVRDLVLKRSNKTSSLATSLSSAADLIEGHVDVAAANGVHWGVRLVLTAILSHFPEFETELVLHGSRCNADLTKD
jgi:hypothetical protein